MHILDIFYFTQQPAAQRCQRRISKPLRKQGLRQHAAHINGRLRGLMQLFSAIARD